MLQDIDQYFSIKNIVRTEIKIKASKFIATAASVNTVDEALAFLNKIRSEFYDATHNCFAYQLGWDCNNFRAADDGEPSGSAGKPILSSIQKFNLSDIIVVVTRYFGGTKLGVGGLVRAYSEAAEAVLNLSESRVIHRTKSVKINCQYEEISIVKRIINEWAVSFSEEYSDVIEIIAQIPISKVESFVKAIEVITNAKVKAIIIS